MSSSHILVGVSSPWASEKFAGPIIDLAQRLEADVIIAHVAQLQEEDEHESDAKQRGEQTLKLLADSLQEAGIDVEGVMLFSDDIPKALLKTARARGCTLIVLGLTGKSMFKRLIVGDVPGNVTRQTDIPVLLFPPNATGTV